MAVLRLIDSVSIGRSLTGSRTEPSIALVDALSIGRSPVGGHVIAEVAVVNTMSAGKAADENMYDMNYLMVKEV